MKTKIFTLLFLVNAIILSGQTNLNNHNYYGNDQRIKLEDLYYQNNFTGIKSIMNDLKINNQELYVLLSPKFEQLQKKRNSANTILGIGIGSMTVLTIARTATTSTNSDKVSTGPGRTIRLWALAGAVGITSVVLYSIKCIKHQDILDFTNEFNRQSTENKIELSIVPEINLDNNLSAGFSFKAYS